MNFMELIKDKSEFITAIKDQLSQRAFGKVAEMKKELSTDLIIPTEDDE